MKSQPIRSASHAARGDQDSCASRNTHENHVRGVSRGPFEDQDIFASRGVHEDHAILASREITETQGEIAESRRGLIESFYDLQKLRIATGNRLVSRCALMLSKQTKKKIRRPCKRPIPCEECEHHVTDEDPRLRAIYDDIYKIERKTYKELRSEVEGVPLWNFWLRYVEGIGPAYTLGLISWIGDIGRFDTVSKLWAYSGLHVVNGHAAKRVAGERANWNPKLRVLAWKIAGRFVRQGGRYRSYYLSQKTAYAARQDLKEAPKGRIDTMARRKTAKLFLAHLWEQWRRLEGLPVRQPYAIEKLGHRTFIEPFYDRRPPE